jgi:Zinc-binding dehydrogenase
MVLNGTRRHEEKTMKAVRIERYGNEEVLELADVERPGKLKVRVAMVLPLAEAKKAHQISATGRSDGKIILRP